MVMDSVQVRLTRGLLVEAEALVKEGLYPNRSEVLREALRRFLWEREVEALRGIAKLPKGTSSVQLVRELREKMGAKEFPINEMNQS